MNKLTAFVIVLALSLPNSSRAAVLPIVFPVQGGGSYIDDFNVTAGAGRIHHGIDIHADKMTPVLAAQGGCVRYLTETEASYGWLLKISGNDGYEYQYIHLNNDTPGTDDGLGGYNNAFAPGINRDACVSKGQIIAYVGDSGNAEGIGSAPAVQSI
jgi:murein DD-endopeptidase MepM/ murein hydrolase activator NlpD